MPVSSCQDVLPRGKAPGARCGQQVVTEDQAAARIQACVRGALGRARVRAAAHEELVFLHMRPRVGTPRPGCWLKQRAERLFSGPDTGRKPAPSNNISLRSHIRISGGS